jgi:hypothetical protein
MRQLESGDRGADALPTNVSTGTGTSRVASSEAHSHSASLATALEYSVSRTEDAAERPLHRGLSHAQAMTVAERLHRAGGIAHVMHIVGATSYEVDRYPPR